MKIVISQRMDGIRVRDVGCTHNFEIRKKQKESRFLHFVSHIAVLLIQNEMATSVYLARYFLVR